MQRGLSLLWRVWRRFRPQPQAKDDSSSPPSLPPNALRGLREKKCLDDNGVTPDAFLPLPKTAESRTDGFAEASINWKDDEEALRLLFADRANSGFGVASVPRQELESLADRLRAHAEFSFERREVTGNKYHGNLLFRADLPPRRQRMIASAIALRADHIPRPAK